MSIFSGIVVQQWVDPNSWLAALPSSTGTLQAVALRLAGVRPEGGRWAEHALDSLHAMVVDQVSLHSSAITTAFAMLQ